MAPLHVLISGGGVAGPALAYWLLKSDVKVTIVERAATPRKTGQAIDIRGPAVKVIEAMGLKETIRARHTTEKGVEKVDQNGRICATFDSSGDESRQNFTSEFEILRGELAELLNDQLSGKVDYIYGDYIKALDQSADSVQVHFANGAPSARFDLVVGADGLTSRTRSLATGRKASEDLNDLDAYTTYFTMPNGKPKISSRGLFYNATGRRSIFLRPTRKGDISAYLGISYPKGTRFDEAFGQGVEVQKKLMEDTFKDMGWEIEAVLQGMRQADDFYMQKIAQVKIDRWSYGRVTLLGDAGYCPSPLSGMGTSLALYGAYILAGEIHEHADNIPDALQSYEEKFRPYVEKIQQIPSGIVSVLNPETWWGISILNATCRIAKVMFTIASWSGVVKLAQMMPFTRGEEETIPNYGWA